MASGPVYVRITAETADLTAKLAVAKAEFASANAELRQMAEAMRVAGVSAGEELKVGLSNAATAAAQTRAEVASLNTQLREGAVAGGLVAGLRAEVASLNTQLREGAVAGGLGGGLAGLRTSIEGALTPLRTLQSALAAFAPLMVAAFAGERMLMSIEHTAQLGANLVKLSEQTGVAVETLSGWHYAAEQADVSADAFDTSIKRLGKSIQESLRNPTSNAAEAFKALGITQDFLRENSNNLEAVLMKMSAGFHAHADGAQADAIAQATLGRGGVELLSVLRQGPVAIQAWIDKQKALGSQWTGETAEAMKAHLQAVRDMQQAWEGIEISIASFLSGPLTGLAQFLTGIEKIAHNVSAAFKELRVAIGTEGIYAATTPGYKSDTRPFAGADSMSIAKGSETAKPEFGNFGAKGGKEQYFPEWKEQLDKQLLDLQLFGKQAQTFELSFWQQKLVVAKAGGKEYETARRELYSRIYQLESQQNRDELGEAKRVLQERLQSSREIVAQVNREQQELKAAADAEWRHFEASIDEQKAAAKGNFDEQLRLDQKRVNKAKELYGQDSANFLEETKKKTADYRAQIDQQMTPWKNLVGGIGSSFDTMFKGILQGTQTFRQMMGNMASNLLATFANMAVKSAETWILQKIREALVTQQVEAMKTAGVAAGEATRTGIKTAAAAEGKAVEAAAGSASVMGDAYKAAAGAYAAVAGIPYIGPILAPIAAVTAFVAVAAFDVFSAERGMDVPRGVNPLTQIHEREMVLPANLADAVRGGKTGGALMGGDISLHYQPTIHAYENKNTHQILERDGSIFLAWIKARARDGSLNFEALA